MMFSGDEKMQYCTKDVLPGDSLNTLESTGAGGDKMDQLRMLYHFFEEPIRLTHQVDVVDGKITETFHVFVCGQNLRGDGATLTEALSEILTYAPVAT